MRSLFAVSALLLLCSVPARAIEGRSGVDHSHERKASRYQIVKVARDGITPKTVKLMSREDGVFFLNDLERTNLNLSVNFGKRPAHCASSLMKLEDDGTYRSKKPLEPTQFVSMCFPFEGEYPFRFSTVGENELVYQGVVSVVRVSK